VAWTDGAPVSIAVDLGEVRRLARVVLVHGGDLPEVRVAVSRDGGNFREVAASPAASARFKEDVSELDLLLGRAQGRYVRVEFGPLPEEKRFTLAELEIWGYAD
jgi:F5/8 type C domain.